jgi:peptidoglycan-associated lipoprotein
MKNILLSALLIGLLAACSSTPLKEEKAPVSESGATTARPVPGGPTTGTAPTTPLGANPLRDPNNVLSKRSVYFDFDSALVRDEFKPLVQAHARYLVEHPSTRLTVQGHTDERGSAEYNLALGQRRSDSVKQAMNVLGASDRQIDTVSFGKEKPKALGHDEDAWTQNRRGDIVYAGE